MSPPFMIRSQSHAPLLGKPGFIGDFHEKKTEMTSRGLADEPLVGSLNMFELQSKLFRAEIQQEMV